MDKRLFVGLLAATCTLAQTASAMTNEYAQSQISPVSLTTTELQTILEAFRCELFLRNLI
jgi:hypothetical protein